MDDWFQHGEKRGLFRMGCARQGMCSSLLARIWEVAVQNAIDRTCCNEWFIRQHMKNKAILFREWLFIGCLDNYLAKTSGYSRMKSVGMNETKWFILIRKNLIYNFSTPLFTLHDLTKLVLCKTLSVDCHIEGLFFMLIATQTLFLFQYCMAMNWWTLLKKQV